MPRMNRTLLLPLLAAQLALAISMPHLCPAQPGDPDASFKAMLALYDTDKDGVFSYAELRAGNDRFMAALKKAGDDEAAQAKVFEAWRSHIEVRTWLAADDDDDLKLTAAEWKLNHERTYTMHAQGPPRLSHADHRRIAELEVDAFLKEFAPFDKDKDGKASRDELVEFALHQQMQAQHAADNDPHTAHPVHPEQPEMPEGTVDYAKVNAVYAKVGRTWEVAEEQRGRTFRARYTVKSIDSGVAMIERTIADDGKAETGTIKMPVSGHGQALPGAAPADAATSNEEITVAAGKFACVRREWTTSSHRTITRWESVQYPGLIVKETNEPEDGVMTAQWKSSSELQSFTDAE